MPGHSCQRTCPLWWAPLVLERGGDRSGLAQPRGACVAGIGEGRPGAYPVASISQPSRFSKGADLGIIRTPLLRLALRTLGLAHSHIRFGR